MNGGDDEARMGGDGFNTRIPKVRNHIRPTPRAPVNRRHQRCKNREIRAIDLRSALTSRPLYGTI
jgi:hypothetical protein